MWQDFRIKVDISQIYKDDRKLSWVFVSASKVHYVYELVDHIKQLFKIKKPFYLLSKFDDTFYFLPLQEDIRVLENNDMVLIIPYTNVNNGYETKNKDESSSRFFQLQSQKLQNGFDDPVNCKENHTNDNSEKSSYVTQKSFHQNNIENTSSAGSLNFSLYQTALHDTLTNDTKESRTTENNFTEDNTLEGTASCSKRKRIRKRKSKTSSEIIPESDTSVLESSGKKPKIIDSILLSSGKHIRFQGLDDEDTTSDFDIHNDNNIQQSQNRNIKKLPEYVNKDLATLLGLKQSSTPLTFQHKKIKRDCIPESVNEVIVEMNMDTSDRENKSHSNYSLTKSTIELNKTKDDVQLNKSNMAGETVSFKVFRMGEDYTPQLSNVILAKVLSYDADESQYTLKILHGKEQLQDPEGKFSLPKDDRDENTENTNIVTLEKSKLLELTKVTAIGTPSI